MNAVFLFLTSIVMSVQIVTLRQVNHVSFSTQSTSSQNSRFLDLPFQEEDTISGCCVCGSCWSFQSRALSPC